jgi:hypothetical protein
MKLIKILFVTFMIVLYGCSDRISGESEKTFKLSRAQMEKKLNKDEKINLEKAFRVITLEAMKKKWNDPEKYNGKSFNDIALKIVDNQSYAAIVCIAEDIVKEDNKKTIEKLEKEITELKQKKLEFEEITKKLDVFKITTQEIIQTDFFDELVPELNISYVYTGKANLTGEIAVKIDVSSISTKKIIKSEISINGYENDENVMKTNDTQEYHIILTKTTKANIDLWEKATYPITDFSKYDLEVKIYPTKITSNGVTIQRPKEDILDYETRLNELNEELKETKKLQGTLSEFELTKE